MNISKLQFPPQTWIEYIVSRIKDDTDLKIIVRMKQAGQRKTNVIQHGLYVKSKKMIQMSLFTKEK